MNPVIVVVAVVIVALVLIIGYRFFKNRNK